MGEQNQSVQLRKAIHQHFSKAELHLLCDDLGMEYEDLSGDTRAEQALSLIEWAKRHGRLPDLEKAVYQRHPEAKTGMRVYEFARYNLGANFTGRKKELAELDTWLDDASRPMFTVIALGGTGKSALTWHWLETIKAMPDPPFEIAIWHGFYETGRIDDFLRDVLHFLGENPDELGSKRVQLNRLLTLLAATPALIVLDGAERLLRAYSGMNAAYQGDEEQTVRHARECVDPVAADLLVGLAQLHNGSKTLISSRLMPQELLGRGDKLPPTIARRDLTGLDPADAYRFFTDWGIQTTRAEVDAVCAPLEYHPFCMALLAGYAADDFTAPNDLRAAANYDPTHDLLGRRQHILQRAYANLPPTARLTLSRLAAFRAAVEWKTIAAIFGDNSRIRADLKLLEQRGLLQRSHSPLATRHLPLTFDLHPIARRYAYERLADRAAVHVQLIVYFEAAPEPQKITSLSDLTPTIELYHHLTRAERYDEALDLFEKRLANPLYFQLGAYQQIIELLRALFPDGEDKPPRLSNERGQAWTLDFLASNYGLSGRPFAAVALFQQANNIDEKRGDKAGVATGLGNLARQQILIGALAEAVDNLRRRIALCQEIEDRHSEAIGHREYGRLLTYCGDWSISATELDTALELFTAVSYLHGQGTVWTYRGLTTLLKGDGSEAEKSVQKGLRFTDEWARTRYPVEREYVWAHWLLGWAALVQGATHKEAYTESQTRLDEALRRCRAINLVELEPSILLAHARLARAQAAQSGSAVQKSHEYAQQALTIAERSGYVLDLADIHNHFALLALDVGDNAAARHHAQTAHGYAFCDGPPYAYQSALDEAERILALLS